MIVLATSSMVFAALSARGERSPGDPGRLNESVWAAPVGLPGAQLTDATQDWGLDLVPAAGAIDAMSGGVAVDDLDDDGDLDLLVAQGTVSFLRWNGTGYDRPVDLGVDDALGVSAADVDGDGLVDVLTARTSGDDRIVWGGEWTASAVTNRVPTELESDGESSGIYAADLTADGRPDILRLGRGSSDVIWVAQSSNGSRSFEPIELPDSGRQSLSAEFLDIDDDGLLDIWVTRDVGWDMGGDSVYSRVGGPDQPWVDIAHELGLDAEIDGMGITIADLDGDADLDAYLSDIGDNELFVRDGPTFRRTHDSGMARIRPLDAAQSDISSSWGSGAADLNLDGLVDVVVSSGGFPAGGARNKIPGTGIVTLDTPSIFLGIGNGLFVDAWPELGLDAEIVGRGLTVADIDGDGDEDVIVVGNDGSILGLRNNSAAPSIAVRVDESCPSAGAVVRVDGETTSYTTLLIPLSYAGAHDRTVIVGTQGETANVSVRFVDGSSDSRALKPTGRSMITLGC